MLLNVLHHDRETIISKARQRALLRHARESTLDRAEMGVGEALRQCASAIRAGTVDILGLAAVQAVLDAPRSRSTAEPFVQGYGDLWEAILEVARERGVPVSADDLHEFNGCLYDVATQAVSEYVRLQTLSEAMKDTDMLGVFAHEVRRLLNRATLAYEQKHAPTAPAPTTVALLDRSLRSLRELVDQSVDEERLYARTCMPELLAVDELLTRLSVPTGMEAAARGLSFVVRSVERGVYIRANRSRVTAALANMLQNAVKFTRARTHVTLSAHVTPERVLIEVSDECGGLPPGKSETLFLPFVQRGHVESGRGLGLVIARRAVEEAGGLLGVRDRPGRGCVFSANFPRAFADP